jgi:hypothetical protein
MLITSMPASWSLASLASAAATSRMFGSMSKVGLLQTWYSPEPVENRLNQTFDRYSVIADTMIADTVTPRCFA